MDRFRTMESFVRVARSGSFTVAASQLGLSRALVSRHVGDLEARLGVRLINRSTRSLSLTDEGDAYLRFCERVFRDIEASEQTMLRTRAATDHFGLLTMRERAEQLGGRFRVVSSTGAGTQIETVIPISSNA